jgi:hypothetical protein
MEHGEFFSMVDDTFDMCKSVLGAKNAEYARGGDKLHNFKVAAGLEQCSPEMSLRGMLTKHVVSIYDMVNDIEKGEMHSIEQWDEKLIDALNYLLLLRGLLIEREEIK